LVFTSRKVAAIADIRVVGDRMMHRHNASSLGHDYTTDVLSWHLGGSGRRGDPLCASVIVCRDFAVREAAARGISVDEELARYVIHGCLHALGFDDHEDADRAAMWRVQEKLVRELFAGRARG
jgi:probable rRNA maturation factor